MLAASLVSVSFAANDFFIKFMYYGFVTLLYLVVMFNNWFYLYLLCIFTNKMWLQKSKISSTREDQPAGAVLVVLVVLVSPSLRRTSGVGGPCTRLLVTVLVTTQV